MELPSLEIYDLQDEIHLPGSLIRRIEQAAQRALPHVLEQQIFEKSAIADLECIEVSIVSDEVIAQVHVDFMDIAGATDVITFEHGEIILSAQTAKLYAGEYGVSLERELMLYVIHGLLHLAGYEDESPEDREVMEKVQFALLEQVWQES